MAKAPNLIQNGHDKLNMTNKEVGISMKDVTPSSPFAASSLSDPNLRKREKWSNKLEFVLSCMAFSIGLGNVWRFPYLCFKNGGGAFLIPYLVCLFGGGVPVYFLEVAIGQYFQHGGITVWEMICPLFKGIGYGTVVINFILNIYYIVILAWALLYLSYSFHEVLPWSQCGNSWNTENCWLHGMPKTNKSVDSVVEFWENEILQISDGIDNPGGFQWWLVLCLFIVWVVCFFCIWRGIKSTGKSVYVTAIFPYVTLTILIIRGITLPGAAQGLKFYLYPNFSKLTESQVWIDAGTQIFFSYAIALGTMTALGSYNDFHNNFYKQLMFVCCANSGTSLVAGFAIFSVLGFMAFQKDVPISEVAKGGPGLAFIAYPKGVAEMPLPYVWAVSFFVMLLLLGIGSQFVAMEGFVTAVVDMFPKYLRKGKRREYFIAFTCFISFLIGLSMVTRGGMYVFQLWDYYGASGGALLWMCFFESIVVAYFYGSERFIRNIEEMIGYPINFWFGWCWRYITPIVTFSIFSFSMVAFTPLKYNGVYAYPQWAIVFGWFLALVSMVQVPAYMIYRLFINIPEKEKGLSLKERILSSIKPLPLPERK